MTLRYPDAILFDWDNTLVDSWGTIHEALDVTFAAMGKPRWPLEETKRQVRLSLRDSFPRHFGAAWEEARRIYLDAFRAIHLERLRPLGDAPALIEALSRSGAFLGVVSNKTGALLRLEAERIGWAHHFGSIVGAGDALADKPDPAPIRLALQRAALPAEAAIWYVGDTEVDMECALASGCVPVLLGDAADMANDFLEHRPLLGFGDGAAMLSCLEGLRSQPEQPK